MDCNSFSKEDLSEIKPFLIKPNEEEITKLFDREITGREDTIKAALDLKNAGVLNVMITRGKDGLIFVGEEGTFDVKIPPIDSVSTIGAGDSLIAGFVSALTSKMDIINTLKIALAFGSAACLTEGTNPPRSKDITRLEKQVVCKRIG